MDKDKENCEVKSGGKRIGRKRSGRIYRIVVRSELGEMYAVAFKGMQMEAKDGNTILVGEIIDQPHLYGILCRLNGLGLELLGVKVLPEAARPGTEGNQEQEESKL